MLEEDQSMFVRAVLMLGLIVVAYHLGAIAHKFHFHLLGENAITMLLALIVGIIWETASGGNENIDRDIRLNSKFFYMVLLPPIIFEVT